jgi:sugar/nucleoside kinase (ribokinase family)
VRRSPPDREFDLLVAGEINPDIVVAGDDIAPAFGQAERTVDRISLTIGSSSAITACGAARLGLRVAFVGVVGDDPFGRWMLDALAERSVDVSACRVDPSLVTGASVILTRPDDRATLTAVRAMAALTANDLPDGLLQRAGHLHVGSVFLQDGLRAGLAGVFARARGLELTTSIDPGGDPGGTWDGGIGALLQACDLVLPNREEALRIASRTGDDIMAATRRLATHGPVVAVKLGPEGGLVVAGDDAYRAMAPAISVVDAIGAGDAFDAGFLAGWLDGRSAEACLRLAVASGSLSVRASGGTDGQPERGEAEELAGRLETRPLASTPTPPAAHR